MFCILALILLAMLAQSMQTKCLELRRSRKLVNEKNAMKEIHNCISHRDGDWIIYICEQCNYELRENWRTGEMIVKHADVNVKHFGEYFPREYREAFENLN